MPLRRTGFVRLWIVLTIIGIPAMTLWQEEQQRRESLELMQSAYQTCYSGGRPAEQTGRECLEQFGANQTFYERQGFSMWQWRGLLASVYAIGWLIVTLLLIVGFYVSRWVVRGFMAQDIGAS